MGGVPVDGTGDHHVGDQEVLVEALEGRGRTAPAGVDDGGPYLTFELRGIGIEQAVHEGAELSVGSGVIHRGTEDETVDIVDVLATNKYLLGVQNFGDYSKLAADVNKDNTVDDSDSMTILKSVVGLAELN